MPFIVDIKMSFPENYYDQKTLIENIKEYWKHEVTNLKRIDTIHTNVLVKHRHLVLPVEKLLSGLDFDQKNNFFIENSVQLASDASQQLLDTYHLDPKEISSIWSNTVTGIAIPSLDARVMNKINFDPKTKRVPLLGLGCMAGVAGINRACDYLKAYPEEAIIFFSVELCSLTVQSKDISIANLISTGLFGDGAAAVLMVGDLHPLKNQAKLEWISSESLFFYNSEDVMGWNVGKNGLKIQLSKDVPELTKEMIPRPLNAFLNKYSLELSDISSFFAHPGGPKVLSALEKVLGVPDKWLKHSWMSLEENGNMSSVSVLDIFKRHFNENEIENNKSACHALSLAMGPGFSAEFGLFRWI